MLNTIANENKEMNEKEPELEFNAAFSGGGVSSVTGLGAYQRTLAYGGNISSFSGASIGALIAICLAAGKTSDEILYFLMDNVEEFCKPIRGKYRIEEATNKFLGGMKFKDLPFKCTVAITSVSFSSKAPKIINHENCGEMSVGRVAALSASLPILFLPSLQKIEGKTRIVLDGGITANPPLNSDMANMVFSFRRKKNSFIKKRVEAEQNADTAYIVHTSTGTRGTAEDVLEAFTEGYVGGTRICYFI